MTRPTDDSAKIVRAALAGLAAIFQLGYRYKKSGVLLMGLQPRDSVQPDLFDVPSDSAKGDARMRVMDQINKKMGKGSVTIAAVGVGQRWAMRQERKSPGYTNEWTELPVAW